MKIEQVPKQFGLDADGDQLEAREIDEIQRKQTADEEVTRNAGKMGEGERKRERKG